MRSTSFCVYALETSLTILSSLPSVVLRQSRNYALKVKVAKALGIAFDARRSTRQVVQDLRSHRVHANSSQRSTRKLKEGVAYLMTIGIGLALAFGTAELVVRVAFRRSMDFDMEMWKYATQIKIPSSDPRVAHEHRPNAKAFLMGVDVTTNSFGLRDKERPKEKPAHTYRIVALGDSITMGWGVEQNMTYSMQLERMLNARPPQAFPLGLNYEVLNLGVGNYNTVQEVMRLKNLGLSFDPDLIILGYFINDAEPTPKPRHGFLIENSYLFAFLMSRLRLADRNGMNYANYYRALYDDHQPGWTDAQAAIFELALIGQRHSIPAMIFIIPEMHKTGAVYPFKDIHHKVEKVGSDLGLPVIDLLPLFKDRRPEFFWVSLLDAHYNAQAQSLVAKGIYDALEIHAPKIRSFHGDLTHPEEKIPY